MKVLSFLSARLAVAGLCVIAALAAGCTFDGSQLRALPDSAVEQPAPPDTGAGGSGDDTAGPLDAPSAAGGSDGPSETGGTGGAGGGDAFAATGGMVGNDGPTGTGGRAMTDGPIATAGVDALDAPIATGGTSAGGASGGSAGTGGAGIIDGANRQAVSTPRWPQGASMRRPTRPISSCGTQIGNLTAQPVDLLLVLDRSGSMADDIATDKVCTGGWRPLPIARPNGLR